jgi:hypothetical protein
MMCWHTDKEEDLFLWLMVSCDLIHVFCLMGTYILKEHTASIFRVLVNSEVEEMYLSKTLVPTYQRTWCHNLEKWFLQNNLIQIIFTNTSFTLDKSQILA